MSSPSSTPLRVADGDYRSRTGLIVSIRATTMPRFWRRSSWTPMTDGSTTCCRARRVVSRDTRGRVAALMPATGRAESSARWDTVLRDRVAQMALSTLRPLRSAVQGSEHSQGTEARGHPPFTSTRVGAPPPRAHRTTCRAVWSGAAWPAVECTRSQLVTDTYPTRTVGCTSSEDRI
jgi:hypothetical protein